MKIMKKMRMLGLGLCVVVALTGLSGCSKKDEGKAVDTTVTTQTEVESTEAETSPIETSSYDLRNEELSDDDSGVKNPHAGFKERFSNPNVDSDMDMGDYLLDETYPIFEGEEKELMDKWESEELTEELIMKMYDAGFTGLDKDEDGLSDYEEVTKYHTDPNKSSTSGDIYSDGYKVNNGMDVTKYYEAMWSDVNENLSILPESEYAALLSDYWVTENYQDVEGMTLFDVGMEFCGDLKYAYEGDLDNLVVEVFNVWDSTYAPVEFTIEDGRVKFHVNEGYDKYLLHSKEVSVDFATLVSE